MPVVLAELVTYSTGCQMESRYTTKSRQRRMERVGKRRFHLSPRQDKLQVRTTAPFFSKPNWPGSSPLHPTWTSGTQWWDGTNTLHLQEVVSSSSAITLSLSSTASVGTRNNDRLEVFALPTSWKLTVFVKSCDCIWKWKKQSKVDRLN